jgi:predicted TIM-barrel fold metal-dependent hydrolase
MRSLVGDQRGELEKAAQEFETSGRRIFYLGFFNPKRSDDLKLIEEASALPGFKGIKIHPSFNTVSADDDAYEPIWELAARLELPIVAHTWSVSSYNPVQVLSTPDKFERYVKKYSKVRFVLGHSGGRGDGRLQAIRMAREYDNVYMDFGGDIYCQRYFEQVAAELPENKVLFGSDYPWIDCRSHLTRVYMADISTHLKRRILRENALEVYRLED